MHSDGMRAVAGAREDLDKGKIDHSGMVNRATIGYAQGLVGRRVDEVAPHAAGFAESHRDQIMWFAPELIGRIRAANVEPIVITGSPAIAVNALAKPLGIDRVIGVRPFVSGGQLTSILPDSTAHPEIKQELVDEFDGAVVLGVVNSITDETLLAAARVRIFVGHGAAPQLEGIVRIPTTPSPQAERALAGAIAAVTEFGIDAHDPRQIGEQLGT
jgi:phosphoserine phosphatase